MSASDEATKLLEAFYKIDKDNDNRISRDELRQALKHLNMDEQKISELMRRFDINGDGIITIGEYKIAVGISEEPLDEWKRLFREIDADHSGRVSVSELKKALSGCINPVPSDVFDEWVSQYDVNKDGELSYEEFLGFVTDQY